MLYCNVKDPPLFFKQTKKPETCFLYFFFLCRFFLSLFFLLCVDILCLFLFFPLGIFFFFLEINIVNYNFDTFATKVLAGLNDGMLCSGMMMVVFLEIFRAVF